MGHSQFNPIIVRIKGQLVLSMKLYLHVYLKMDFSLWRTLQLSHNISQCECCSVLCSDIFCISLFCLLCIFNYHKLIFYYFIIYSDYQQFWIWHHVQTSAKDIFCPCKIIRETPGAASWKVVRTLLHLKSKGGKEFPATKQSSPCSLDFLAFPSVCWEGAHPFSRNLAACCFLSCFHCVKMSFPK